MKTYQQFAKRLFELLGNHQAVRINVTGFMPLTIEEIGPSIEGHRQISLTHYGKQHGDLMRDPEMIFALYQWDADGYIAEPVYFRNDYLGLEQEVYTYRENPSGNRTKLIAPHLKRELTSFARTWFRNLRAQGFLDRDARREVLS